MNHSAKDPFGSALYLAYNGHLAKYSRLMEEIRNRDFSFLISLCAICDSNPRSWPILYFSDM